MSTINNSTLASYFSLNDSSNSASSQTTATPSLASALAALNSPDDSSDDSSDGSSYLLDLSDSAKNYLQQSYLSGGQSSASASTSDGTVVLNHEQQTKLNAILLKYKDAPYNDDTFQKIQQDMSAAGIGADTLAAQAQMRQLNPTLMLLDALGGGDGSAGAITGGAADIKTQTVNFMQKVSQLWQAVSTTYGKTTDGTDGSTTDGSTTDTTTTAGA